MSALANLGLTSSKYYETHSINRTKGKHVLNPPRISDVLDMPVKFSGSKRLHPNEKPISWIIPCIEHSSNEGDTVLDPFAGSGTVAIACKMLGRKSISVEIDKKYSDVIKKRIA